MRPKPVPAQVAVEANMFRNRLENMIDMRHELVQLAGLINWQRFDDAFGPRDAITPKNPYISMSAILDQWQIPSKYAQRPQTKASALAFCSCIDFTKLRCNLSFGSMH